jgi:hypothetical protein
MIDSLARLMAFMPALVAHEWNGMSQQTVKAVLEIQRNGNARGS